MVSVEYPVQLGVAYLFLVGYMVRTAFLSVRLPGTVGVMFSGFAFSFFMQGDIFHGREHLQELAFFLVLLTAGTEISLADLKPHILLCAIVPAACEMGSVAAYAYGVLHWTRIESCILGTTLFALGDGLVIPKMSEFGQQFPGHPLPRLVFIWAPLEASFALTLFGVMSGLAEPAGEGAVSLKLLVLSNALRILATLGVGSLVGAVVGWTVSNRSRFGIPFTGSTVEAYLLLLSAALGCFGLSCSGAEAGATLVPMGFAAGSLFQPELMVIVIGCFFARVVDAEVLHDVEQAMGGVWVFGQLVLFSMLGSKTDVSIFAQLVDVLPVMAVGLSVRFLAVLLTTFCGPRRGKSTKASRLAEAVFCFLSTLPRATIQGAVGQVPVTQRFFQHDPGRRHVQAFISVAARLYIVCMSVLGSVVLDAAGPWLLAASSGGGCEDKSLEEGWTLKEQERLSLQHERASLVLRGSVVFDGPLELTGTGRRRSSSVLSSRPRTSSMVSHLQPTSVSARRRFSSFTNMHQLEGRITEELDEQSELGELWVDDSRMELESVVAASNVGLAPL